MYIRATVLISLFLCGCSTPPIRIPPQSGQVDINPTSNAKLGHLYFSGPGQGEPGFQTADGKVWYELCYNDYKTAALADLSAYIAADSTTMTKATGTLDLKGSVGVPMFGLVAGPNAKLNSVYTIEQLRLVSFSSLGVEHVKSSIGQNCKDLIAEYSSRKDITMVLLTSAQRADKVSEVTTIGGGIGIGGGSASVGSGSATASVSLDGAGVAFGGTRVSDRQFEMIYFTGLLAPQPI